MDARYRDAGAVHRAAAAAEAEAGRATDNAATGASARDDASVFARALIRSKQQQRTAPCCAGCASGADIRGWIAIIAQREKLGLSESQAMTKAWSLLTEVNPFPASLGRICPHPCESGCSRASKDGAIAINALERFLGDWALKQRLRLLRLDPKAQPESIGVIGAGPAGLSFAYQLARRGYRVTVYEKEAKPGGMLFHGIPQYRLPEDILDAEIKRIVDLGVEMKLGVAIGKDVSMRELRERHEVVFLGIGAGLGLRLNIPGEEGAGVWTGTEYLSRLNRGQAVAPGAEVVVVGGGNTAMDAARSARRSGARVTVLYRRTRKEMPAIAGEVDDALAEGVQIEFLTAPVAITREGEEIRAVVVQRMQLGESDASGRRKPVPLQGSEYELPATAVIAAVSQVPNWEGLDGFAEGTGWIRSSPHGEVGEGLWVGGDTLGLGIAGMAISQGRQAAENVHAQLRKLKPAASPSPPVPAKSVKADYYSEKPRAAIAESAVDLRLTQPELEVQQTISKAAFLDEVSRCFSCGSCFGCEQCFMYCNAGGFVRLEQVAPGAYFSLALDQCEACGKCIEVCPCGFLSPR